MFRNRLRALLLILVASVAVTQSPAVAGVMTQTISINAPLGTTSALLLPKFESSLGTLMQVSIEYDVMGVCHFGASRPAPSGPPVEYFSVSSSLSLGSWLTGPLEGRGLATFASAPGQPGRSSPAGVGFAYVMGNGGLTLMGSQLVEPFVHSGGQDDTLAIAFSTSALSAPLPTVPLVSWLGGSITTTYVFSDAASSQPALTAATVPEPASLTLFGLAAIGIVATRRRVKVEARSASSSRLACASAV